MRKKDVKGLQEAGVEGRTQLNEEHSEVTPEPDKKGKDSEPEDCGIQKSRQGTIKYTFRLLFPTCVNVRPPTDGFTSLIGIDTKRVADFASFNNAFPETLFNLIISLAFLLNLIGWRPLLAGFTTTILFMPLNIYFSKKYSDAQVTSAKSLK